MKNTITVLTFAFLALVPRLALAGPAYDELNGDEKAAIQRGELVIHTQDVDGAPWPKMWVYQRAEATPEECAAVATDYELRTSYTKDLLSAKISRRVDAATTEVDYLLHVPIFSDEHFTLSENIAANGPNYILSWHLVRADRTKTSDGSNRFEPLGTGTLLAVTTFTDPDTFGAGMVTDTAIQDTKDATTALINQVQNERNSNQGLLQRQIQALRQAIGH